MAVNKLGIGRLLRRGIIEENTVFRMAISLCPAIAVTATVRNGFLMGAAVLFVQTMVSVTVSIIRKLIHPRVRIPIYMLIISGWVTVVDLLMAAFAQDAYRQMGLYIQLIVAFASILAGVETFSSRNNVVHSFFDGIGRGAGFLVALVLISAVREILGKGSIAGVRLMDNGPLLIMVLPAGGFFTVGLLMGFFNWVGGKMTTKSSVKTAAGECAPSECGGCMKIKNDPYAVKDGKSI